MQTAHALTHLCMHARRHPSSTIANPLIEKKHKYAAADRTVQQSERKQRKGADEARRHNYNSTGNKETGAADTHCSWT